MISRHSGCLLIVSVACFGLFPQPWASAAIVPSNQLAQATVAKSDQLIKGNKLSQKDLFLGLLGVTAVAGGLTFLALRRRSQPNLPEPAPIAAENSLPQLTVITLKRFPPQKPLNTQSFPNPVR
jgi:hypothetical protein